MRTPAIDLPRTKSLLHILHALRIDGRFQPDTGPGVSCDDAKRLRTVAITAKP